MTPELVNVKVTARHIVDGERADSDRCPLALALRDAGFQFVDVEGGYAFLALTPADPLGRYRLSRSAVRWIAAFDDEKPVAPRSFALRHWPPLV